MRVKRSSALMMVTYPNYQAMIELLFSYLEPGFRIPMLNDTNYGHTNASLYLYEFAYRELGGDKQLYILNQLYRQEERNNLEAFIYGVDKLTECNLEFTNYHVPEGMPGNTILRGSNDRYLLFKHDSYGGEHDHYDRLAISYLAYGKRISADMGTTGYGARMHYDYYKNTGSHNQSPVNAVLERYEEKDGVIYVTAVADWTVPYEPLDSFTIVQWQEENYWSVRMERKIAWTDDYFVEVFKVKGAYPDIPIDWVMHFSGDFVLLPEGDVAECFTKKPYKYFHSMKYVKAAQRSEPIVAAYADGDVVTHVFSASGGQELFYGKGPDNPSISDLNYQVERCFGSTAVFAHVISSSDGTCKVKSVVFEMGDGDVTASVEAEDGLKRFFVL